MNAPHAQRLRPSAPPSFPSAALRVRTFCCQGRFPSLNHPHSHTLTFDPGRSMAEHTTSLALTGSSPSCCCRQRYLLSGGQSSVQHKQGPHQALRRAETRKLRGFLAYSWMCAPHVPVLLQYFCLPLWIMGELQWRWWGSLTPDYYRCEPHTPRASFFLVFGMGELSPGLHTH